MKTKVVQIRLSDIEINLYRDLAKERGYTLSSYIRHIMHVHTEQFFLTKKDNPPVR